MTDHEGIQFRENVDIAIEGGRAGVSLEKKKAREDFFEMN